MRGPLTGASGAPPRVSQAGTPRSSAQHGTSGKESLSPYAVKVVWLLGEGGWPSGSSLSFRRTISGRRLMSLMAGPVHVEESLSLPQHAELVPFLLPCHVMTHEGSPHHNADAMSFGPSSH